MKLNQFFKPEGASGNLKRQIFIILSENKNTLILGLTFQFVSEKINWELFKNHLVCIILFVLASSIYYEYFIFIYFMYCFIINYLCSKNIIYKLLL